MIAFNVDSTLLAFSLLLTRFSTANYADLIYCVFPYSMATVSPENPLPAVNSRQWVQEMLIEANHLDSVRPHQLDHAINLINGTDVFLVIATGMGKTTVLLLPLQAAHKRREEGVGIMVVPTKVLAEQQVSWNPLINILLF